MNYHTLDIIPSNILITDSIGKIKYLNKNAADFLGINSKENLHSNFFEFVLTNAEEIQNIFRDFQKQNHLKSLEIKLESRTKRTYHTSLTINKFSEVETDEELFIISLFDLTEHKMQTELVKQIQIRFENIANSAPVMIWITDVNGLFIFVNKIWSEFTGRSVGEELGLNWIQDVHPEEVNGLMFIYQKALEEKTNFAYEYRFKRKDDKYRWIMINGIPRFNEENFFIGFIGTCIDITHQKENESYIKQINEELENANKNKDKFFSIISHDLRSPLSGIMSLLDILVSDYEILEEDEKKEILDEAANTSKNTFTLMENLLDWSRIQTGKITYDPQNISLTLILSSIRNLYYQKLREKGITLNFEIEPECFAYADLNMTETILRNLISNALKFTPEFGIIIVSFEVIDSDVIVKVKDTGVGMTDKQISNLFKLDQTNSTIGTSGERGTGLGLLLCKELVEKQGGKLWIQSELKNGSIFFFTLPKARE